MRKLLLLVVLLHFCVSIMLAQVKVHNLLTENLSDPIGIDVPKPRFSWQLSANQRGLLQTAYEIKVSVGKKAVWTTGKTSSDQSVQVGYEGTPLESAAKYHWQVRVWDNKGKVSAWSAPAAKLNTYYGKLHSGWKLENEKLLLDIEIPANTTAIVYIPAETAASVTENGLALSNSKDIQVGGTDPGYVKVKLGSGSYHFVVTNKK